MDYQVTCIVPHNQLRGRIQAIGGPGFGVISEDTAISWIQTGVARFHTYVGGRRAEVIVEGSLLTSQYLKTTADGYLDNNLLHLPRCTGL